MTSTTVSHTHAVVVGGSLAGLMTALGLARAGLSVTVLERSGPAPRSGAALGNADSNRHRLFGPAGLAGPEATAAVNGDRSPLQTWQQAHQLLHRAAAADPRITLLYEQTVRDVDQDSTSAWATTTTGRVHHGQLLVGADGHRSIVRRAVAPGWPDAAYAGYVIWLGIADAIELGPVRRWPAGLDIRDAGADTLLGYPLLGEDGVDIPAARRLGWAWFDPRRNDLLRETGCITGNVVQHSMRPADVPAGTLAELDDEARQWPSPWRDAIRACIRRRGVTGTPIAEYVPDHLVDGRIALVGDAAHVSTPMTGRGFAVALDDAETLTAGLIGAGPGEIAAALQSYERLRLQPGRELVLSGRRFSQAFAGGRN